MLFKLLWMMLFCAGVIVFAVLNQHTVVLHLFWINLSLPASILVFLSILLGSFLQSFANLYARVCARFKTKA
jgi:uncharacterized integral membrane protein